MEIMEIKTKIKYFFVLYILVPFMYRLVRLYSFTFRFNVKKEEEWLSRKENGTTIILACWHQQFFSVIRYFKKYKKYHPCLMISPSKDGEVVARIAKKTGWHPVRGSSSRDGAKAMIKSIRIIRKSGLAAHVIDGPRGPAGIVKLGLAQLGKAVNAEIVPFYVKSESYWQFNSWDKFFIPKPFSKVELIYDNPIKIDYKSSSIEEITQKVQNIMSPYLLV